jgi:hypothetical protein
MMKKVYYTVMANLKRKTKTKTPTLAVMSEEL